jgi:PiT family inorganic phosphate transporter
MSPEIGFVLALLLVLIVSWLFVHQTPFAVDSTFLGPAIRFGLALFARP